MVKGAVGVINVADGVDDILRFVFVRSLKEKGVVGLFSQASFYRVDLVSQNSGRKELETTIYIVAFLPPGFPLPTLLQLIKEHGRLRSHC